MANETKYSVEEIGIIAVLSVIGFGFLTMVVALIRAPDTSGEQSEFIDPIAAVLEERSYESVRNYNKPLAIHTHSFQADPYAMLDVEDQHEHLVPDAPEDDSRAKNDFNTTVMPMVPGPVMRQREDGEEDALTGESKERSGWGWLADDINSRKGEGSRNELNPQNRNDSDKDTLAKQEEQDEQDKADQQSSNTRKEERELMGQSALMDMDSGRDPLMSPLREMENGRDNRDSRANKENDRDNQTDEQARARGEDPENQRDGERPSNALDMRDPFARNTENDRPEFGSRDWQFGESDSSAFRPREDIDVNTSENNQMGSIGSTMVDVSGRIVGDAVSDSSRLSAGWSGYASDSIFSGGGGYTPQGVQAVGSEPMFSGAGVFGGGVGSVVGSPLDSSSGGIRPIGGSSLGGLPASGSTIGESSFDDTPRTPSALPW